MIKTKSNLLVFDKQDKNGNIFPKECAVTIPDFVPVLKIGCSISDPSKRIGMLTSHHRNDFRIEIETVISFKDEDILKKAINAGLIYSGGYYRINKIHTENGVNVIDSLELKYVGLYTDDVFGDNDLRMEVIEDD